MPHLDLGTTAVLFLLCLAMGPALLWRGLMWIALALFCAAAWWVLPGRDAFISEPGRPVEALVRTAGQWVGGDGQWATQARVLRLRQGLSVSVRAFEARVSVTSEAPPPAARVIRVQGFLKAGLRYQNEPLVELGGPRLHVPSARLVKVELAEPHRSWSVHRLRARLDESLQRLPEQSAGRSLVEALLLGRRESFPADWSVALQRLGLAHVLAVSGLHVGLIGGLAWFAFRPCWIAVRVAAVLILVWVYAALVGDRSSVHRAAVMISFLVGTRLLERPPAALNALALAVLVLLLRRPSLVQDLAFQLSVAATGGLLVLGPLIAQWWKAERAWSRAAAASLGAHLAAIPLAVPAFFHLPLAAPLLGLVVLPWTSLVLVLSVFWALLALLAPALSVPYVGLLSLAALPYAALSKVPPSTILSVPLALETGPALVFATSAVVALRRGLTSVFFLGVIVTGGLWLHRPRGIELVMFDVGQGDSILLRDGSHSLLIDGGGWRRGDFGGRVLRPALAGQGVRRLDAVVVTHPDLDHCGGLADLSARLPIAELWIGPGWIKAPCVERMLQGSAMRVRVLWAGDRLSWRGWRFLVLHPRPGMRGSANNRSLVLMAESRGTRVLLTGDIGQRIEEELVRSGLDLRADILKIAHHGSRGSTSAVFLDAVQPSWALIPVGGANVYGHPAPQVLERLRERGIATLRTDHHGEASLDLGPQGFLRVRIAATAVYDQAP